MTRIVLIRCGDSWLYAPMVETGICIEKIRSAFLLRKQRNVSYSIRAFARDLGISKTAITGAISGERRLSRKNTVKISEKLAFSPSELKQALNETIPQGSTVSSTQYETLDEMSFQLFSNWYMYAILNLAKLKHNLGTPLWISKQLGISQLEAKVALQKLQQLGRIKIENKKMVRVTGPLSSTGEIPNRALREYHRQCLKLAEVSLERDPVEERVTNTITMAIDPKKMKTAKRLINEFQDRISDCMETEDAKEVYTMGIYLFPATLTRRKK